MESISNILNIYIKIPTYTPFGNREKNILPKKRILLYITT